MIMASISRTTYENGSGHGCSDRTARAGWHAHVRVGMDHLRRGNMPTRTWACHPSLNPWKA